MSIRTVSDIFIKSILQQLTIFGPIGGLINPAPGVIDLDGFRALQPLFDAAKAAGIWVVLRPGMYIPL